MKRNARNALPPAPIIPDADLYGGIGAHNVALGGGAIVQVPAFTIVEGDVILLFWAGEPAGSLVVGASPPSLLSMRVDRTIIERHPGKIAVTYTIQRPFGDTYPSEPKNVVADFDIPGGVDQTPSTPSVNENLEPLEDAEGVDPTQPFRVTIPRWLHTTRGDRLHLVWGKSFLPEMVVADDLGKPGPPFMIDVPVDVLAANTGQSVLTYFIIDEVGNHSLFAPGAMADVGAGGHHDAPSIVGTLDDGTLPIESLDLKPASVIVKYVKPAAGDVVTLIWGGVTAAGVAVTPTSYAYVWVGGNVQHTFSVPYDKVVPLIGGEIRTSYTVLPSGATIPTPSRLAQVKVTSTAAGLPAPTVKEAVGSVLDPAALTLGATIQVRTDYAFVSEGDRVTIYWHGESKDGSIVVTDQQTRKVDGTIASLDSAGADAIVNPLEFVVPKAKIDAVAGGKATVHYKVLTPLGTVVPSASFDLTIKDAAAAALPAPSVDGTAPDGSLDPDDVGATIVVRVPANAGLQPPATVLVTWAGTAGAGSFVTPAQPASASGMRFDVDRSVLAPNAGKPVTVSYTVRQTGSPDRVSDTRVITVLAGDEVGDLPAPTVREATGAQLDPLAASTGCTVVVPSRADIQPTDQVTVTFGSHTTLPQAGAVATNFAIPAGAILSQLGSDISVFYTVVRNTVSRTSDALPLKILDIPSDDPRFAPPSIDEALGGFSLDMTTFNGDATVSVEAWPLMAANQSWSLEATGAGTPYPIANGQVGTVGDFTKPLSRTWLAGLADGASLSLVLTVSFNQSTTRTFRSPAYRVKAMPAELTYDFDALQPPFDQLSSSEDEPRPYLRFDGVFEWLFDASDLPDRLQYIGVKTLTAGSVPGIAEKNVLRIGEDREHTLVSKIVFCDLFLASTYVRFGVSTIDDPFSVSFRNEQRQLVGPVQFFDASSASREVRSIDAPATNKIKYIEIRCVYTIHLDFFTMKPGEFVYDFDALTPPFRQLGISDDQINNPLRFEGVFDWRFDATDMPTKPQVVGVKALTGGELPGIAEKNVLRIGHDTDHTLVRKVVFCDLLHPTTRVRFGVSSINDKFSVSFKNRHGERVEPVREFDGLTPALEVRSLDAPADNMITRVEIHCVDTIHIDFFATLPGEFTYDFDALKPPFDQLSSSDNQIKNPLRFIGVFDWRFDTTQTLPRPQYISAKTLTGGSVPGIAENNVLRIGEDPEHRLVEKVVFCDLYHASTHVRFGISEIDAPFTVSFQNERHELIGPVQHFDASAASLQVSSIDAPASNKIKRIEIRCVDTLHLDFFAMKT